MSQMNVFPLIGIGAATLNSKGEMLDVRYHYISSESEEHINNINSKGLNYKFFEQLTEDSSEMNEFKEAFSRSLALDSNQKIIFCRVESDKKIDNICDAYLKLYLLSLRVVKPNSINLEGIFSALPNVAWTNQGPVDPKEIESLRPTKGNFLVRSVDKFPCLTDYLIPTGVRIGDSTRVRLGAYLSEGTTVMHEGFVNFNAGTLGAAMIEGRISAGVVVGKNSDLGGGCSTMGTLSGGNDIKISVGDDCLLGANSGLGIPLGDRCIVEAGLYLTGGSKVEKKDKDGNTIEIVKASDLSHQNDLLFIRNSLTGVIECRPNMKNVELNETLHSND